MVELGGFELGRVHCVDCLEAMKLLPDKSVDLVLTDPPYGHNNNNGDLIANWEKALGVSGYYNDTPRPIANDGREADDIFRACAKEYSRLLVAGGCCCCCCGGGGPDPPRLS